jgi:hypothetical protein
MQRLFFVFEYHYTVLQVAPYLHFISCMNDPRIVQPNNVVLDQIFGLYLGPFGTALSSSEKREGIT